MFIGHYAVALAAKKAAPKSSLATALCAAELLDFVWPALVLTGVEHFRIVPGVTRVSPLDFYDYPYSHSFVAALGWAVLFGVGYYALRRYLRGALVLGSAVLSHWACDVVVHRADLPVLARGPYWGWGLWNSLPGTVVVEGGLFLIGLWIYLRATRPKDRAGTWIFAAFVAFTLLVYVANLFGPPPPSTTVVAWMAMSQWLMVVWAGWADRHRTVVGAGTPRPAAEPAEVQP